MTNEELKGQITAAKHGNVPARQESFRELVDRSRSKFAEILPSTVSVDRFLRVVLGVVNTNPALRECEPNSVLSACVLAAQLGLEPGPLGHAYLVPFKDKGVPKAQFIIGYKGFIRLARQSGEISSINVGEVCENDAFEFEDIGPDMLPYLRHKRSMDERGPSYAYYVITHYRDGSREAVVLTRSEIEKYRRRSRAHNSPAWRDDYDAMAIKTVCRRAATFWPLTIEAQSSFAADGAVSSNLASDLAADAASVASDFELGDVFDVETGEISPPPEPEPA